MFERIARSWELVKASWAVLRSDKELIVFPIVSTLAAIVVLITFAIPTVAAGIFDSAMSGRSDTTGILGYIVAFIFYVVMYTVIFYFNTALVGAAMIRLQGGDPTVSDGFSIASKHSGKIIGYALISATVGMILRAISERGGIVGEIVSGLFGFAWGLATFMVVPVLVLEDVGPIEAIKRSAALLKKTWGEQLVGNFSIGTIFGLLILLVIIVGMVLFGVAASLNSGALMALVGVLAVIAIIALSLISSTLDGIYKAALYRYAVDGETGGFFDPALIEGAFRHK